MSIIDTNQDGKISLEELEACMENLNNKMTEKSGILDFDEVRCLNIRSHSNRRYKFVHAFEKNVTIMNDDIFNNSIPSCVEIKEIPMKN